MRPAILHPGHVLRSRTKSTSWSSGLAATVDVHRLKTAALFAAACEMGAIAAGRDGAARALAAQFGEALGRLFQAVDDLLDVTGDAATLGKTPG